MSTLPVIEFGGMSYIRWNGFYVMCDLECPGNDGKPHVWVSTTLSKACGKCKRITWNRKDERFKTDTKRGPKKSKLKPKGQAGKPKRGKK